MSHYELTYVLKKLGYKVVQTYVPARVKLVDFAKHHCDPAAVIVHVANHYMVLEAGKVIDNQVCELRDPWERQPYCRKTVYYIFTVIKEADARLPDMRRSHVIRKEKDPLAYKRELQEYYAVRRAKKVAAEWGIHVFKEDGLWWVECPDLYDSMDDPFEGDHIADGGHDVERRVTKYVNVLKCLALKKVA